MSELAELKELRKFIGASDAIRFEMLQMALEENRKLRDLLRRAIEGLWDTKHPASPYDPGMPELRDEIRELLG